MTITGVTLKLAVPLGHTDTARGVTDFADENLEVRLKTGEYVEAILERDEVVVEGEEEEEIA